MIRKRVVVSGRVQDVFFRDSARREADSAGVAGWVRNLSDGRVEAVFEGSAADVDRLVRWCRSGPDAAEVSHLQAYDEAPEGLSGFSVR